jgi:hypothetical protein
MDRKMFVLLDEGYSKSLINLAHVTFVEFNFEENRPEEAGVYFGPKGSTPLIFKGDPAAELGAAMGVWKKPGNSQRKKKKQRTRYENDR